MIPFLLLLKMLFMGASEVFHISKGNAPQHRFQRALFVLAAPSPPPRQCIPYVGAEVGCLELGGFAFVLAVPVPREDVIPQGVPEAPIHRHDVALGGEHEFIARFVHWVLFVKQLKERWDRVTVGVQFSISQQRGAANRY